MRHAAQVGLVFCLGGAPSLAFAQDTDVKATAGKPVQIGYYSVLRNDCSGGAVPQFKMAAEPRHGVLVVKPATLKTKRLAACGTVEAPALVVIYKPRADYAGSDAMSFAIVNPETGRGEPHNVRISVMGAQTEL